jgi:DNA polymerase-3 subunit delta'
MNMGKSELALRQPIGYAILTKAFASGHLSHAYLFSGKRGSKQRDMATLFAQTLICPHANPWACEECEACLRVANGNYHDMIVIDGQDRTIKKEEILRIQEKFAQTALESAGKKIYIIDPAENATTEALNSLLKYLEEPAGHDTHAILISQQPERLLETIISRCQTIPFVTSMKDLLDEKLAEMKLDPFDAHMLRQFVSDPEEIMEVSQSEDYKTAVASFGQFIDEYSASRFGGELYFQSSVLRAKEPSGNRKALAYFLRIGMLFFKDVEYGVDFNNETWNRRKDAVLRNFDCVKVFMIFNESENKIGGNANLGLLIDSILYQLKEVTL